MLFSKMVKENKVVVEVTSSMTISDLANKLQTYGFTYIPNSNSIWYKGYSLRLISNNNRITFNKFSDCVQYDTTDTSTIFPSGRMTIYLDKLDFHISKIEENINNGEIVRKEAEFKLQLFLPYIQQKILDVYPYDSTDIVVGTKVKDENTIMYSVRSSLYSFGLVLNKRPYKFLVEHDFDDYILKSDILFTGIALNVKEGTLTQWLTCLPTIFEKFKMISEEINVLDNLKRSLTTEANEKILCLEKQKDEIKAALKNNIAERCVLSHTQNTMNAFVKDLF